MSKRSLRQKSKNENSGFSLIEVSVALVVLGFVTVAIFSAGTLIRNSKLVAAIKEIQSIKIATGTFLNRYGEMPGDSVNVAGILSSLSSWDVGNGDGFVGNDSYKLKESHLFFKHISYSGMMDGKMYDALDLTLDGDGNIQSIDDVVIGETFPNSKLKNSYFYYAESSDLGGLFRRRNRIAIFSKERLKSSSRDSYDLDIKIDDGFPFVGKTVSAQGDGGNLFAQLNGHGYAENNKSFLQYFNPIQKALAVKSTVDCFILRDIPYCKGLRLDNIRTTNQLSCFDYNRENRDPKICLVTASIDPKQERVMEKANLEKLDCKGSNRSDYDCLSYCTEYPDDKECQLACKKNPDDPLLTYCLKDEDDDGTVDICETEPSNPICVQVKCFGTVDVIAYANGNAIWPETLAGTKNVRGFCYGDSRENPGGYPMRDCLSNGDWGKIKHPCISNSCPEIIDIDTDDSSGYAIWPETNANQNVVGTCIEGYEQKKESQPPKRKCGSKGIWGKVTHECRKIKEEEVIEEESVPEVEPAPEPEPETQVETEVATEPEVEPEPEPEPAPEIIAEPEVEPEPEPEIKYCSKISLPEANSASNGYATWAQIEAPPSGGVTYVYGTCIEGYESKNKNRLPNRKCQDDGTWGSVKHACSKAKR